MVWGWWHCWSWTHLELESKMMIYSRDVSVTKISGHVQWAWQWSYVSSRCSPHVTGTWPGWTAGSCHTSPDCHNFHCSSHLDPTWSPGQNQINFGSPTITVLLMIMTLSWRCKGLLRGWRMVKIKDEGNVVICGNNDGENNAYFEDGFSTWWLANFIGRQF